VAGIGGERELLLNPDVPVGDADVREVPDATAGLAACEEARAALADDVNLNTRLVLEQAFLRLAPRAA
ncbi:MAG TPA: hypothetical protein VEC15_12905, partial [Actinomycetota bacterium]|nr:hypothetical protein [Actinomycetota bacterium]